MIGKTHLPISAGGGAPDPAVYCPANGYVNEDLYIPNPILPADGWNLLCQFQTNSPYTTTFDPSITATAGQYAWDFGDGSIIIGDKSVTHTYLTTATRTVKLYGKGTCTITAIDFNADNIVGTLDISNAAFASITNIVLQANGSMTGFILPSAITGIVTNINIQNCNVTGNLDISGISKFGTNALLIFQYNPNLTGFTMPASITQGTLQQFLISSCNVTGTLDLSWVTAFGTSTAFGCSTNPNLTGITFASTVTGSLNSINCTNSNITGVMDLSMFKALGGANNQIFFPNNTNLTGVTFASAISGTMYELNLSNCRITGNLNISGFATWSTSAQINLHTNAYLTGVTFAPTINSTGKISNLGIYSTGITGVLDISGWTGWIASGATLNLSSNPNLTGILFNAATMTGILKTLSIYSNPNLQYVDFSKQSTAIASLSWQMQNNGWSAAIVNQVLVTINSISAAGFASRVINVGGTNVDPDTTSGGYDGVAARNALIAKGITVSIT